MLDHLTVLGSGSIIPHQNRSCAGYVIRTTAGPLLMDCGPGSLLRLHQAGISLLDLRNILISHFHLDHISDLLPVLHSRWLQGGRKKAPATVIGPMGLKRWFRRVLPAARWVRELDLKLTEMGNSRYTIGDLDLSTCLTGHTKDSIAFRVSDAGGRVLFYSGDADDYRTLVPLSGGADPALVECSWPSVPAWEGHLTPELAGRLAAEGQVRRLLLTHFYQPVHREEMLKAVAACYTGPIELAEDLKHYTITPH
jgi:ribonuclease BN (tRNA processing enzyme)